MECLEWCPVPHLGEETPRKGQFFGEARNPSHNKHCPSTGLGEACAPLQGSSIAFPHTLPPGTYLRDAEVDQRRCDRSTLLISIGSH